MTVTYKQFIVNKTTRLVHQFRSHTFHLLPAPLLCVPQGADLFQGELLSATVDLVLAVHGAFVAGGGLIADRVQNMARLVSFTRTQHVLVHHRGTETTRTRLGCMVGYIFSLLELLIISTDSLELCFRSEQVYPDLSRTF